MELNKEIQTILLDYTKICIENNWTKEQMEIRSVYDTFRIQNIVENLSLSGVVRQSEQLSKRPNTSSTWECFTRAEKQNKGNV